MLIERQRHHYENPRETLFELHLDVILFPRLSQLGNIDYWMC